MGFNAGRLNSELLSLAIIILRGKQLNAFIKSVRRASKTFLVSTPPLHFFRVIKSNTEHCLPYENHARTSTKIDRRKMSFGYITAFQRFWKWQEEHSKGSSLFKTSVFFLSNKCDAGMFYYRRKCSFFDAYVKKW